MWLNRTPFLLTLSAEEKKKQNQQTTMCILPGGRKSEPLFYSPSLQFYASKVRSLCRELRINQPTKSSRNKLPSGAHGTLKSLIAALRDSHLVCFFRHVYFAFSSPASFLRLCLHPLIRSLNSVTSVHFNSTHIIR